MMHVFRCLEAALLSLLLCACSVANNSFGRGKDISPYDFGLASAKTGTERYDVLVRTHKMAVKTGVNVDYSGIATIELEIPKKASRIPLTSYNDFKGCVFLVKNMSRNCWLFEAVEKGTPIKVSKRMIDSGNFQSVNELKHGRALLIIEDENLWVQKRKGYAYGHTRKDILLIENGVAKNKVTMPYDNDYSSPKCTFIKVNGEPIVFKNLTIKRSPNCSFVTNVVNITGHDGVSIQNVSLITPESKLNSDRGLILNNCTNVSFENVRIDGTYSQKDHYGYGVNMNNVWNFTAKKMYGNGNWGIFGNNNLNTVRVEDSKINRFDIHCYGRDILFSKVDFFDLYNQFSSVYGTITYDKCTFTDFVPVLNGGSYNSFVEHDVSFNDCVFNASRENNCIFKITNLNQAPNTRHELSEKKLPNVTINNMTVNLTGKTKDFFLFYCKSSGTKVSNIGYFSRIDVNGLTFVSDDTDTFKEMSLSNIDLQTQRPVDCKMTNVEVVQPNRKVRSTSVKSSSVVLKANIPLKEGKVVMKNVKNLIQK